MTTHPSGLAVGDRVRWRSTQADDVLARLAPGQAPAYPIERDGVLIDEPSGQWVRIKYDDAVEADSALVETLTRLVPATAAPEPDDVAMGVASWDVDPIEVAAYPSGQGAGPIGAVTLDGRSVSPAVARRLSAVLAAAADHAEGRS